MKFSSTHALRTVLAISMLALGLTACGAAEEGGDSSGGAEVTVSLSNLAVFQQTARVAPWRFSPATALAGPLALSGTASDPTGFSVRIKSISLVEDQDCGDCTIPIGNNIGNVAFLWTNPDCPSGGSADADCADIGYFDLNRPTAAVNTDLNAQAVSVTAGTYRYVKLGLLGEQSGGNNTYNNTKWSHAGSSVTDKEFASIQTEWAAAFAEPLVVADGDQVTLTLGYDLNNIVDANTDISEKVPGNGIYQPGFADDCETVSTVKTCVFFPDVSVSATTE